MTGAGWSLGGDGCLTLWGNGPMEDWEGPGEAPWSIETDRIRRVEVGEGLTSLGAWALWGCGSLEAVSLPAGLRQIGACAFGNCTALTRLELPPGTAIIGAKAFTGCTGLQLLSLPATLRAVDMKAFRGCTALREVRYGGTAGQWEGLLVSRTAQGNRPLLQAKLCCAGGGVPAEPGQRPPGEGRREAQEEIVRAALAQGGDGRLHILAPDLSVPGSTAKPGDCTLFVFPQGQTMLLDTGVPQSEGPVLATLRRLAICRLDCLVLSHPHIDHMGNALAVARYLFEEQRGGIGCCRTIGLPMRREELLLADYLRQRGVALCRSLRAGDWWSAGEALLTVLAPTAGELAQGGVDEEAVNNLSLVLRIGWGASACLACGDLYRGRERLLAKRLGRRLRADVMKSNHHGLFTSNGRQWLETVAPRVILTEGDDIGSSALAEQAVQGGAGYYSTGVCGAVLVTLDGKGGCRVLPQYGPEPAG